MKRRDAQLARERAHALPVLLERGRAVAAQRVQPDHGAVSGLVQRVEVEPAAGVRERGRPVARRLARLHEPAEHRGELASQPVRLAALPVLERGRVPEAEALEEVAPEHGGGLLERIRGRERAEAVDVDRQRGAAHQRHPLPGRLDRVGPDRPSQRRERAPERAARMLGVVVGPQQLGEDVTRARTVGEREVGEQRERLAGIERDGRSVAPHLRRPQQHDLDRRHLGHRNDFRTPRGEGCARCTSWKTIERNDVRAGTAARAAAQWAVGLEPRRRLRGGERRGRRAARRSAGRRARAPGHVVQPLARVHARAAGVRADRRRGRLADAGEPDRLAVLDAGAAPGPLRARARLRPLRLSASIPGSRRPLRRVVVVLAPPAPRRPIALALSCCSPTGASVSCAVAGRRVGVRTTCWR